MKISSLCMNRAVSLVTLAVAMAMLPKMAEAIDIDVSKVRVFLAEGGGGSVKTALEELCTHLERVCGGRLDGTGVHLVVGARPDGEPAPGAFESHVAVADGKVWFWGDDSWETAEGWETRQHPGTLFAVYLFLDEVMKVRWPYPGDKDTVVPHLNRVRLADTWRGSFRPPLEMSEIRNYGVLGRKPDGSYRRHLQKDNEMPPPELASSLLELDADARNYDRWLLRNRVYTRERFKYGHAFTDWQSRYLASHPDWFGLSTVDGETRADTRGRGVPDRIESFAKFCLSNPEVREAIVADWRKKGMPKWHNVCPNDGSSGFCRCTDCMKLDARQPGESFFATLTDRYVWFWNRLAEDETKLRPDVKLITYIYSYYRQPPRRERIEFPDNIVAGTVPSVIDDVESFYREWRERGLKHHFFRPNYLCYHAPFYRGCERLYYNAFQTAVKYGSIGVDFDGGGGDFRQKDLESYVIARMTAYPGKPFEEICEEFYSAYGAAAGAVRKVRERIRKAGEEALDRSVRRNVNFRKKRILDDSYLGKYSIFGCTEEMLTENVRTLTEAMSECAGRLTAEERNRLQDEILRFRHQLLCFRFCELGAGETSDSAELVKAAKELHEFRLSHKESLGHMFSGTYGVYGKKGVEAPVWKKVSQTVKH